MIRSTCSTRVIAICLRDELEELRARTAKVQTPPEIVNSISWSREALNAALKTPGVVDAELALLIACGREALREWQRWAREGSEGRIRRPQ
jgi:hypothetical protein